MSSQVHHTKFETNMFSTKSGSVGKQQSLGFIHMVAEFLLGLPNSMEPRKKAIEKMQNVLLCGPYQSGHQGSRMPYIDWWIQNKIRSNTSHPGLSTFNWCFKQLWAWFIIWIHNFWKMNGVATQFLLRIPFSGFKIFQVPRNYRRNCSTWIQVSKNCILLAGTSQVPNFSMS